MMFDKFGMVERKKRECLIIEKNEKKKKIHGGAEKHGIFILILKLNFCILLQNPQLL